MGILWSKILGHSEPKDYDVVDENTGLTPREVDLIKSTWAMVKVDIKSNGVDLFIKLFDYHPEYQKMFSHFAEVPRDKLKQNGRLLGHATSVMYALTSIVDNLTDVQCLKELIVKIAESHIPRNVHGEHFRNLAVVVLELLDEKLGPSHMTEATKTAWKKALDTVNSIIIPITDKN